MMLFAFGMAINARAQQDPQFSQHMFTKLAFNPGFAGANGAYCGTLLYRNQWTGFGGEPKTMLFTADAAFDEIYGGAGLTVISEQIGFDKNLSVRAAYAYRMDLGAGKLGLGVDFGLMQKSIASSSWPQRRSAPCGRSTCPRERRQRDRHSTAERRRHR